MSEKSGNTPYHILGDTLKTLRKQMKESVAEVCGAVEIDEEMLIKIEQGNERPSEDILMLLMNHFGTGDEESERLWELAGYEHADDESDSPEDVIKQAMKQHPVMMVMALDQRVMYSDGAEIYANKNGLTLHFTQSNGTQNLPIAKVGMSYEQAKNVLEILVKTLADAERLRQPRQLPSSSDDTSAKK